MKVKVRKRIYKMKDADLVQFADDIVDIAERDETELLNYGVTAATVTAVTTARTAFVNFNGDIIFLGAVMLSTEVKNASRLEILKELKQISGRARIKFGQESAKFRTFETKDINNQPDNELVRIARSAKTAAEALLAELTGAGLTQGMIDNLETLNNAFDIQIDLKRNKIRARDTATDERIKLGNELYTLVAGICENGKLCWEAENEAKYNDYVIYKNAGTTPPQFETEGTVSANSGTSTTVSGISSTTNITLKNTGDAPLQFFFAEDPTDIAAPISIPVAPQTQITLTANLIGFNEDTDFTRLNVYNPSPLEGSFSILWD